MKMAYKKVIFFAVIVCYFGISGLVLAGLAVHWKTSKASPEQPVKYSHNLHVNTVGLGCTDCHIYTDKSVHAGLPALEICMDCHSSVAIEKPEIRKLLKYSELKEQVPWRRVYQLPDFVYFSHKRHVKKGVDCSECHGEIKAMDTARKIGSLEMGWCVNCHRKMGAPTDCVTCHK
ncbi:MAG: cytochrome c3 family protein [Planctomycetes bacterium]|nr:cytochrome c3 family protein [Planctomycetota bacterium]